MKKMALQILLFIPLIVFTQNYPSIFRGQGTTWVVKYRVVAHSSDPYPIGTDITTITYYLTKQMGDTIVDGTLYHKIGRRRIEDNFFSICLMYQDTLGKIYYYENGNNKLNFDLDYNNHYVQGDTIWVRYTFWPELGCPIYETYNNYYPHVIDTIIYRNGYKWIYAFPALNWMWMYGGITLVENIGSSNGGPHILQNPSEFPNSGSGCVKCLSYNDTIFYLNIPPYSTKDIVPSYLLMHHHHIYYHCDSIGQYVKIPGRCDTIKEFLVNVPFNKLTQNQLQIYPTLGSDNIYIENLLTGYLYEIEIKDFMGRTLKKIEIIPRDNKYLFNIEALNSGMYFIEIFENKEKKYIQKIIKL